MLAPVLARQGNLVLYSYQDTALCYPTRRVRLGDQHQGPWPGCLDGIRE
jgi:hypothetical protein